jgi:hypothetical protein
MPAELVVFFWCCKTPLGASWGYLYLLQLYFTSFTQVSIIDSPSSLVAIPVLDSRAASLRFKQVSLAFSNARVSVFAWTTISPISPVTALQIAADALMLVNERQATENEKANCFIINYSLLTPY